MTYEYGDPISPEAIDQAVALARALLARAPDAPLPALADEAVRRSVCPCVIEIEDSVEGGLSGVHEAVVAEVMIRLAPAS
jgi:hypothetical protein